MRVSKAAFWTLPTTCGASMVSTPSRFAHSPNAAGTTPTTLYERFSNKDDLLALLRRRALNFFTEHPHDYRLVSEGWGLAFVRKENMPTFDLLKQLLASQLGGEPDQQTSLPLSLVALLHATTALLCSSNGREKTSRAFRPPGSSP